MQSLKDKTSEFIFVAEQKKDIGHLLELARKYESKHLEKRCAAHLGNWDMSITALLALGSSVRWHSRVFVVIVVAQPIDLRTVCGTTASTACP